MQDKCMECEKFLNCYYKQLKRKEQECEALQQSENEAGEIIAELKNDYAELEKRHNDSFEQFKNLKMICDDYKIANAELCERCSPYCKPNCKESYKTCLRSFLKWLESEVKNG